MACKTSLFVLILTFIFICPIFTQNCIEYPDIGGSTCDFCSPTGWDIVTASPDIISGDGSHPWVPCILGVDGESPSGGNMVFIVSLSSVEESISTTINGLIPNLQYALGFYWHYILDCTALPLFAAELIINVDGEIFTFSGSDNWELVELCITPESEEVTITISAETLGDVSYVVFDSGPNCVNLIQCCQLLVEINEDEATLCAGENYSISTTYSGESGGVNLEWTCEPNEGLDYLSAVNITDPIFNFPFSENHEGGVFEYTLLVEDDECSFFVEIEIEVVPNEVPEFDIEICALDEGTVFYTPSDNLYSGSWSGNFDFEAFAGTVATFTYTLDANQDNCLETHDYEIYVEPIVELFFNFEDVYCESDDNEYELPNESFESVEGDWNNDFFVPSQLGSGIHDFIFSPDPEICAEPTIFIIEVLRAERLAFNLLDTFCFSRDSFMLPQVSIENIGGNWSNPTITFDSIVENQTNVFTAIGDDCIEPYIYTYSVLPSLPVSFQVADTVCRNETFISLNNLSLEGYLGSWFPQQVLLDTITEDSINFKWIPDNLALKCIVDTVVTIYLSNDIIYELDIPISICTNSGDYILPSFSTDNIIEGSWNIPIVQTENTLGQIINIEFTPNNECVSPYLTSIEVIDQLTPSFNIQTQYCKSDPAFTLPYISEEGHFGTWSQSEINPSIINSSITTIFVPTDACVESLELTFFIADVIDPIFDLPTILCDVEGSQFEFPTTSINGIEGEWTTSSFISEINIESNFTNTFIPFDNSCYSELTIDIPIGTFSDLILSSIDPSDCQLNNGFIIVQGLSDIEVSIDSGINWFSTDIEFDNLSGGDYSLEARFIDSPFCIETFQVSLSSPDAPTILEVITSNITGCLLQNGTIECIAEGTLLEYSIDDTNWQTSNIFSNLQDGIYEVSVRVAASPDCSDTEATEVEGFLTTSISSVDLSQPSDCNQSNGSILIQALGQNIEYSIDNGSTWTDSNTFENLSDGTYTILVRSKDDLSCFETTEIILFTPSSPIIDDVITSPISDCESSDGTASVMVVGQNLEYSINNGEDWQSSNAFFDLGAGSFLVLVRNISYPNCISEFAFSLISPDCPCANIEVFYDMTVVNCADVNSGEISITNIVGLTFTNPIIIWSNGTIGDLNANISEGEYVFTINYDNNCAFSDTVELGATPPLEYNLIVQNINCLNKGRIEIVNVSGGSTPYHFSIDGIIFQDQQVFENLDPGNYTIVVKDVFGCEKSEQVIIIENLISQSDLYELDAVDIGEIITLDPRIGISDIDSFAWYQNDIDLEEANILIEVLVSENTVYTFVYYQNNCSKEITYIVSVKEKVIIDNSDIYVGNMFSPNDDGNNDIFYIQSSDSSEKSVLSFSIYDRWGNLIYKKINPEINNDSDGWSGRTNNENANIGVYAYVIKYETNIEQKSVIGHVTLVR